MDGRKLPQLEWFELVRERLKNGTTDTFSAVDPRCFWIYAAVLFQAFAALILFAWLNYSIHVSLARRLPFGAVLLIFCGLMLRRYGHPKLAAGLEITGLTYLSGVFSVLILFPLTELSWPFADRLLAGIDNDLGFFWPAFAKLIVENEWLLVGGQFIYHSFNWQPIIVVIIAVSSGQIRRCWVFVTASAFAAIATMAIYPFVPAAGPCVHYGLSFEEFGALGKFPWQFGPELARLREQSGGVIRAESVFAMVSFPSYHAVAAVLFAWAVWPIKWARIPFLVFNLFMLAATVVIGIHYLSDVLGGILVAIITIILTDQIIK